MTDHDVYEETTELPPGRKPREIGKTLRAKLEESHKRGVGFSRTAEKQAIDDLRKDLTSAAVKAEYIITTATAQLDNGLHKLTFTAKRKPAIKAEQKETVK